MGDGLLDDAGSEAGDIVGTGTAGAGNADRKVSEVEIIGAGNIIFVVICRFLGICPRGYTQRL